MQDFSAKRGVVHSEVMLPEGAPEHLGDRERLWNEVEAVEVRKDAQLAREVEFAIPREMTQAQGIELARDFAQSEFVDQGMIADVNVHWDIGEDGLPKPHGHVMLTMREVTVGEDGSVGFGGEESAGASFLRLDGTAWTTDKDGILLALLASEILAVTGKTPSQLYAGLVAEFGDPAYERVDAPATPEQKATLGQLAPEAVTATTLAGEDITAKLSHAPGNGAAIGGLKVQTEHAWFAARPSGTEDVYKLYAESLISAEHLAEVQAEGRAVVAEALGS